MSEGHVSDERQPLDEDRRLAYLDALGVRVWEARAPLPPVDAVTAETATVTTASGDAEVVSHAPAPAAAVAVPAPAPNVPEALPAVAAAFPEPSASPQIDPDPWCDWAVAGDDASADATLEQLAAWEALGEPPALVADAVNPITRMDWTALEAAVRECHACCLWETRTKTVFGIGDRRAELLIVGEAPGVEEDHQGEPFVGRAGQLLTRMLAAIGFSREQVYIANVLKCRPPGNRDPQPDEALACQAYLQRQVALIEPKLILAVGRISAQHLLQTETAVGQLRGRWFDYGPTRIPLRVTYHPAYLLRSPEQKAKAWDDLTALKQRL